MTGYWYCLAIVCLPLFFFVYKKFRVKFPIFVNCWFCNKNTVVTLASKNSWLCPYCEQYNGFNEDGGYNKIIEEQHCARLNKKPLQEAAQLGSKEFVRSNGLCKLCNLNQELKVQQLARFVPTEEENFDIEIKKYREQLEKSYHLCSRCEEILKDTLERQRLDLLMDQSAFVPLKFSGINDSLVTSNLERFAISSLKVFTAFLALWIALALLSKRTAHVQAKILDYLLPDFFVSRGLLADVQVQLVFESHKFSKELTGIGFLSYFLSTYKHRSAADVTNLVLWSAFHVSTWTDFVDLQLFMSLLLFVFAFRAFPANYQHRLSRNQTGGNSPRVNEGPDKSIFCEQSVKGKQEKIEVKSPFDGSLGFDFKIDPDPKQLQAGNFFEKPKGNFQEGKLFESTDEIHNDMTHLNLGTKRGKIVKPANFLFQACNFKTKNTDVFPLLKPPKLFKTDQPSFGNSTPSASPSGIKFERLESKNCCDFTQAGYPISATPFHHVNFNNFPCFEGNHFCSDFNYQEHDLVPFSNGLSNVPPSMYSYSMRDSVPYSYKCMRDYQSLLNKRDGLEKSEDVVRKYLFDIRWDRIKSCFYATSVFLNFLTLFFLCYYAWSGLILFELRLPNFNFFI